MAGPNVPVVKGINAQAVRAIPDSWDAQWFKRFISDHMQKMDYRNATAGTGITITGTEQTTGSISAGGTLTSPVIIPAPVSGVSLTVGGAAALSLTAVTTATTATGGAATLPASPVGFFEITILGTVRKIPYYAL